jgi:hypothetical protein
MSSSSDSVPQIDCAIIYTAGDRPLREGSEPRAVPGTNVLSFLTMPQMGQEQVEIGRLEFNPVSNVPADHSIDSETPPNGVQIVSFRCGPSGAALCVYMITKLVRMLGAFCTYINAGVPLSSAQPDGTALAMVNALTELKFRCAGTFWGADDQVDLNFVATVIHRAE